MIAIGIAIGAAIIALDEWLKARKSNFRVPVLAAAIGIYLPLALMVTIFLDGLLSYFVERRKKLKAGDEELRDRIHPPGTLVSAGLLTGEALMGIAIAIPSVVSGSADVLAPPEHFRFCQLVGLGGCGGA